MPFAEYIDNAPAIFSLDRRHRYLLRRKVGFGNRICLFVCLNPSTATEYMNDPTIRRCMGFAAGWNYGILEVANIFALRSTDPLRLYEHDEDPIGPENDEYIEDAAKRTDLCVVAWGDRGKFLDRGRKVLANLQTTGVEIKHLGLTLQRQPRHPLYLRKTQQLLPMEPLPVAAL